MASHPARKKAERPHLKPIPGGEGDRPRGAIENLLSGRVSRAPRPKRSKKQEIPPQEIESKELRRMSDLFIAGRNLEKEIRFKVGYAQQKLDEYCRGNWIDLYVATDKKPPSIDYLSDHSRFKFVVTSRTTLTPEKIDQLEELGIPVERQHTELKGLRMSYDAIRRHRLEDKLREALSSMHVSSDVINEIFVPDVELKDSFYDRLLTIVRSSLRKDEDLGEKMLQVIQILDPTTQIRNTEIRGLNLRQCFELVEKTEVAEEDVA